MTIDEDLDIMNSIRDLPDEDAAFYFRAGDDDGFYYYTGTVEHLGETLLNLMIQDKAVLAVVAHAVDNMEDDWHE